MADNPNDLPAELRERAIALMLELNRDPEEHALTPEKAAAWIDFEVYRQNWHAGRIEHREDNSDHPDVGPHKPTGRNVWPHPEAWIGTRDLDASLAVWNALEGAGEDPKSYWGGRAPRGSRTTRVPKPSRTETRSPASASTSGGGGLPLVLASPLLVFGYAVAAFFTTVPLYVVLAAVSDSYTVVPDSERELVTAAAIVAVLTGWYCISGVSRALRDRPT